MRNEQTVLKTYLTLSCHPLRTPDRLHALTAMSPAVPHRCLHYVDTTDMGPANYSDIHVGDEVQCYEMVEKPRD
jgi:hypothetical protein